MNRESAELFASSSRCKPVFETQWLRLTTLITQRVLTLHRAFVKNFHVHKLYRACCRFVVFVHSHFPVAVVILPLYVLFCMEKERESNTSNENSKIDIYFCSTFIIATLVLSWRCASARARTGEPHKYTKTAKYTVARRQSNLKAHCLYYNNN